MFKTYLKIKSAIALNRGCIVVQINYEINQWQKPVKREAQRTNKSAIRWKYETLEK
ncbi:MAG TPA: hypothetical protein V6C71_03625 [Coleofasciculaceae cyanobacterium]|jgi:hypothetical protein